MRRYCILWCLLAGLRLAAGNAASAIATVPVPVFFMPVAGGYGVRVPGLHASFARTGVWISTPHVTVAMAFQGSLAGVRLEGYDDGPPVHFLGGDRQRVDVPACGSLAYRGLYAGIDLVWHAGHGQLKSEFVVAPGADPGLIRIAYTGIEGLDIAPDGALLIRAAGGDLQEEAPAIYQEIDGARVPVSGSYKIAGPDTVAFELGPYDAGRPLVIDPAISYSTYLGGSQYDSATAVTVDAAGSIYLTGWTESPDFPLSSAVQGVRGGGTDVFIAKLDKTGATLQYCTYLGGTGDDRGFGIAVDPAGSAYVTGWTQSSNFPVVAAVQTRRSGSRDAFVAKLNPAGNSLLYSTFLGGTGSETGRAIAVDGAGNAYVAGETTSANFPTVRPLRASSGGLQDGFLAILDASGRQTFGTYWGGSGTDGVAALALDAAGNIYLAGGTDSPDFPTAAALQPQSGGGQDAFIVKLAPGAASLVFSTYLGGSGGSPAFPESAAAIDVNGAGEVFVAGITSSADFPVHGGLRPPYGSSGAKAFYTRLNAAGSALVFSTLLGGSSVDAASAVRVTADGSACVAGYSFSADFPLASPVQNTAGGDYDAFVSCFDPADNSLVFSTLLGGSGADSAAALATDGAGTLYIAGQTLSANFPLAAPYQNWNGGGFGAFLTRIPLTHRPAFQSLTPASGGGASQTFRVQFADSAGYQDIASMEIMLNGGWSDYQGCHVSYDPAKGLQLLNDTGTTWLGPLAPGASGTLQNSQCTLDGGGSSVSGSGSVLTLNVALSFRSGFGGGRYIYVEAKDKSAYDAGWQWRGTWEVPGTSHAPAVVSWTPASGTGSSKTFTLQLSDAAGSADILAAEILINSSFSDLNGCHLAYYSNGILLLDDRASTYLGPVAQGAAGSVQNSQCTVTGTGSSTSGSGSVFTWNVTVAFSATFAGNKNVYVMGYDRSGLTTGWQYRGIWAIPGAHPPAIASLTPANGTGTEGLFTLQVSDSAGAGDIASAQVLFNTTLSDYRACHVSYIAPFNILVLLNDAGTAYSGGVAPGTAAVLQNSQCQVDVQRSSVSLAGNLLTLKLPVTFTGSFAGGRNAYAEAYDSTGADAGWQLRGSWSVPGAHPPAIDSVAPSAGSGNSLPLAVSIADAAGASDIVAVQILISDALADYSSCHLVYVASAVQGFYLLNDGGTAFLGPIQPGGTGALQNSRCRVDGRTTTASVASGSLVLQAGLSFTASFMGSKSIYVEAQDSTGISAGWQRRGSWTAAAP